jgi:Mn-containing catalase
MAAAASIVRRTVMFLRIDKLQIELPTSSKADPNAAAAVQELLGGRFGEMSTLNNYLHQSVAMKAKKKLGPFYELVASITAEELGHVELVVATINALLDKAPSDDDPNDAPFENVKDMRFAHHFIQGGPGHTVANSHGAPWTGDYVFNSGNLVLDLLHNFFLESGARTHKARVYDMTSNETARTMIGYLLVRGGVHQAAYGLALEKLTGVNMTKMLPVPNIDNKKFEHTRPWESKGEHAKLYTFSMSDYMNLGAIWNGTAHWADDAPLEVVGGHPEGGMAPEGTHNPSGFAPDYEPEEIFAIAQRLVKNM